MSKFNKILKDYRATLSVEGNDQQDEQEEKVLDQTEDELREVETDIAKTKLKKAKELKANQLKNKTNGSEI